MLARGPRTPRSQFRVGGRGRATHSQSLSPLPPPNTSPPLPAPPVCVCVCVCVCNIPPYIFVFAVYLLVYTCVLKSEFGHVWLLATLVYVLKFLYVNSCVVGGRIARNLSFNFIPCPLYVFIHFSAVFCTAHCALDLAKDHAP